MPMYSHMCTLAHIHKGKEQTVSKDIIIIENVFRNTYPPLIFLVHLQVQIHS